MKYKHISEVAGHWKISFWHPKKKRPSRRKYIFSSVTGCDREHIEESGRTFVHDHQRTTGHLTTMDIFSIVKGRTRALQKVLKNQFHNKSIGKHNFQHVWDQDLLNSPKLTFKTLHCIKVLSKYLERILPYKFI